MPVRRKKNCLALSLSSFFFQLTEPDFHSNLTVMTSVNEHKSEEENITQKPKKVKKEKKRAARSLKSNGKDGEKVVLQQLT